MPRPTCSRCNSPISRCFCYGLQEEHSGTDIIILQHPSETRHPLNTARILELGISNCRVFVGEGFNDNLCLQKSLKNKSPYLLFPTESAITSETVSQQHRPEVIILLDGTWRKARKIYYTNSWLQNLPCVTLTNPPTPNYRIRKSPGETSLSTVEATVTFLREIHQNNHIHQHLLDTFDRMIQRQIDAMGERTFKKNYST